MRLAFAAAALSLLAGPLLAGCQTTPPEQQWSKPGATLEDVRRDLYWCTTVDRPVQNTLGTPVTDRPANRVVDAECMENRGYRRAPKG